MRRYVRFTEGDLDPEIIEVMQQNIFHYVEILHEQACAGGGAARSKLLTVRAVIREMGL